MNYTKNKNYVRKTKKIMSLMLMIFLISVNSAIAEIAYGNTNTVVIGANDKADQIVSSGVLGRYTQNEVQIEILKITKIPGAIEVFARAWDKGKQIGFGSDGSVDIERFKIYNPPVLVPDERGDVKREYIDLDTGETSIIYYRKDPKSALIETLFSILSVKKERGLGTKIVSGKIGNTTSTFFSEPDPATTAGDGWWQVDKTTWNNARSATTSVVNLVTQLSTRADRVGSSDWRISRSFLNFDTSSLSGQVISSSTLTITLKGNGIDISAHERDAVLVEFLGSAPSAQNSDFNDVGDSLNNPTEGANRIQLRMSEQAGTDYNFELNATGTSWIDKAGVTKLGLRSANDADNSAPSDDGQGRAQFYSADETGTTNDPKLVVEHTSPTTVRIYAETTDGYTSNSYCNVSTTWAAIRSASSTANTVCDTQEFVKVRSDASDDAYQIYRGLLIFNTSIIPDSATLTSATLNLYGTTSGGENTSEIVLVSHSKATSTTLTSSDWHIANYGSTAYGSSTDPLSNSTYNEIDLNSSGLSGINKTDSSVFGLLTNNDFTNTDPGASRSEATFISANASGTSTDPYIQISYIP